MPHRPTPARARLRRTALLLAAAGLALELTAVGASSTAAPASRPAASSARPDLNALDAAAVARAGVGGGGARGAQRDGAGPLPFRGIDGLIYQPSYPAVQGTDATLFIGEDFDTACQIGPGIAAGLRRIKHLADLIERSGRRVLYGVAPNKSSVETGRLIEPLPHGTCSDRGLAKQVEVLDRYRDPRFVHVRRRLVRTPNPFWRTDAHWSTVGATVYAEQVARALSPRVAKRQRYTPTERTRVGDLMMFTQSADPETAPALLPSNGVRTVAAPGSEEFDPTLSTIAFDHSWRSVPARKTVRGQTLLLGDSFTYTALEPLRNLFAKGRFLWLGFNDPAKVVQAVLDSDTVVMTVVQRYTTVTPLLDKSFRRQLTRALRAERR